MRLSQAILRCANRGLPRIDFLREVSGALLDFSGCDAVEVRLSHGDLHYRWQTTRRPEDAARFEVVRWRVSEDGRVVPAARDGSDLEQLCWNVARREFDPTLPYFTTTGSFWSGDTWERLGRGGGTAHDGGNQSLLVGGHYRSLAVIRFVVDDETVGLLHLKSEQPDYFTKETVELFEGVAQAFGLALAGGKAQAALRERVKELTCLYGIAQVVEQPGMSLDAILHHIVLLLPPAWQYPEMAGARITLDDRVYATPGFRQTRFLRMADIIVSGQRRGAVEVAYLEQDRPELAAEPFLKEEDKLIAAVAREVSLIVHRKEADQERSRLQSQLIHADRLATIGQLTAGVAHELNEPLGSILGFAQLAKDCPGLPEQAGKDINKVITASLYAREVIRKLMVFSRQVPPKKLPVNLNQVIDDGLYLLEARCAKSGIQVVRDFARELPEVTADPAQLKQVLVNLVVNAVQAMPHGGTLTVSTRASDSSVLLVVQDTGVGMTDDVQEKAFLPFFTTKDVSEGTGLGLAVVHGIVTSHGGTIDVESRPGIGTRFVICLPVSEAEEAAEVE